MDINNWVLKNKDKLIKIRRHLHSYPEVGFKENNTSNYIQDILKKSSLSIKQNNSMQTGFYIEYGNTNSSILAIRCDLDALPIQDKKNISYSSRNDGVMHACGHDAHMTIATGLALWLKQSKIDIPGIIRIIYQPAEETAPGGAVEMIKGGVIKNVDHIIGYHVFPKLKANQIGIKFKYVSAAVEAHSFILKGRGGHTSRPEETDDLISIASNFISRINYELNKIKENVPFVLTFGHIKSGYTYNVIPDNLLLRGTFRYLDPTIKDKVYRLIKIIINDIASQYKIDIIHEVPYSSPPIINEKNITQIIKDSAINVLGKNNVIDLDQPSMGGEDFSYYLTECPGSYFRIGSDDGKSNDIHTPMFDINEDCIFTGIKVLSQTIKKYFKLV